MHKIAILDVAAKPSPHFDAFEHCGLMVKRWLDAKLPEATLICLDIKAGEPLPEIAEYAGFILPGSEAGVYDDTPWMELLRLKLLEIREAGKPIYGICFGHQMMAHTYGGWAEKADKGFCLGERQFRASDGSTITSHVSHQDQVVELPSGATVIAGSEYCPVAALEYDYPALSTQFHPEYHPDFIRAIADFLEGDLMNAEQAEAAKASLLPGRVSPDLFADEVAAFFRRHL